tara:strand:- start:2934 stop:4256 length:1323 start_codon:yes stop_codon:yes gene_type:complete
MASWKKVIVSGSDAELNGLTLSGDLTVSGGDITLGATSIFSGGDTTSLNNIDALDATTEATIESALDTLSNVTTVGTLNAGAISSGFGNIDNGTSTLNTGNATVDNLINASAVSDSHITGSFTGSFSGDGSNLTGVAQDIELLNAYGAGTLHQTQDKFLVSDNGTEKSITFSNLEDSVFANVSGDATIAAGGALTIANGSVENDMLAGSIANGKLSNDGITIAGVDTSLGGTITAATIGNAIGALSASVNVDHDATTNFVANEHIDHTSVSVIAGTGLTGGGTIAANRTLNVVGGTGVTANANDIAIGQDVATNANVTFASVTTTGNAIIAGNLDVTGTTTTINTTNLLVEDRFILMNSGSSSGDGGFIVQTEAGFTGTAFGWDDSAGRFGLQVGTKLAQDATAIAPDSYIASVVTSDDSNYQKNGNIRVQGGEIYIYVE